MFCTSKQDESREAVGEDLGRAVLEMVRLKPSTVTFQDRRDDGGPSGGFLSSEFSTVRSLGLP